MANITNIAITLLLLNEIMLASHVNREVFEDLGGKTGSFNSFEFESLYELVLGCKAFTSDFNHTDVYVSNQHTYNHFVDGETSVVSVVVVLTVVLWFQIVATVEELTDVGSSSSFDDELATGMVGCIVSSINNKIIDQKKMSSTFASDCVELFLGHHSCRFDKINICSEENLVTNFHNDPWNDKCNSGSYPEMG